LKSDKLDVRNSPLERFASYAARILFCVKGVCETATPIGISYPAMAAIDEIRKIKGLEPIFLPFLANLLITNSEASKIYAEHRKIVSQLTQNGLESQFNTEELSIIEKLKNIICITNEEAED
jgi:hypothetical protein